MSSNSLKQFGVSSQTRSMSEIIESLRNSFQSSDFKAAENELMAREEGLRQEKANIIATLREKSDLFEGERNKLRLEKLQWEEERRRLKRELDVYDDQLKDITKELSLKKENEEKTAKRYGGLIKELKDIEEEKNELICNLASMTEMVDILKRNLREKEVIIDELTREKECQRDARFEELMEAEKKIENLKDQKEKFDNLVKELRRCDEQKDESIKELSKDIKLLEEKKMNIEKEKDRRIQELEEEKGILELEMRDLKGNYGEIEEKFSKLEQDVIACLCLDLRRDKNFAGSKLGKILSKIIMALDCEDLDVSNAGVEKDSNIQKADSVLKSNSNEAECGVKSDAQPVYDVRRKLVFDCDDVTGNMSITRANVIIIDSDDDNDGDNNSKYTRCLKNKRKRDQENYEDASDDSLNPILKTKKLEHVDCEQVKQKLTSTTQKQR